MMDHLNPTPYDPKRLVRLLVTRPLFFEQKRREVGDVFEVEARHACEILQTQRADFVDQKDRNLVYKKVMFFS